MASRPYEASDALRFRLLDEDGDLDSVGVHFSSGTVVIEDADPMNHDVEVRSGDGALKRLRDEITGTGLTIDWVDDDIERLEEAHTSEE